MLDVMYLELVEDTRAGVTAVVQHISTRIEQALFHPLQTPSVPYKLALRCGAVPILGVPGSPSRPVFSVNHCMFCCGLTAVFELAGREYAGCLYDSQPVLPDMPNHSF
jgi:hypothetical protein